MVARRGTMFHRTGRSTREMMVPESGSGWGARGGATVRYPLSGDVDGRSRPSRP
ncbi:MAG: hypothetical protein RLZZ353_1273, partial [Actinomycetota bacterium]